MRKNRQERLNAKVGSYLRFGAAKFNDVSLEVNKKSSAGKSFVGLDVQDKFSLNGNFFLFDYQVSAYHFVRLVYY